MSARAQADPPFPANQLEADLQRAQRFDDRAYALRALSRSVVCLAQPDPPDGVKPSPGRPLFRRLNARERPLPVAQGRDGRPYLLVFTSSFTLFRYYHAPDQVWLQTPAGELAESVRSAEIRWMINANGPLGTVLEASDVATVADISQGRPVPEAILAGPASSVLLSRPGPAVAGLTAVLDPVVNGGFVSRVVAAVVTFDEERSRSWLRFGVELNAPAGCPEAKEATRALMGRLVAALEAATAEPVELRLLTADETPCPKDDRWLQAHGTVIWPQAP